MKKLVLERMYLPDRTIGVLKSSVQKPHDTISKLAATLEPPWKDNQVNVSCIPEGVYHCTRDTHGKHQVYKINGVYGRTAIEFHGGRVPEDSLGCVLVGGELDSNLCLLFDDGAEDALIDWAEEEDFILHIKLGDRNTFR